MKEIEEALLNREIDLAVHSSKDMPAILPEGLAIAGVLPREDPHEAVFDAYAGALAALISQDISSVLRGFEKRLLAELGYAPLLETDAASRPIDPERLYSYEPERGPVPVNGGRPGQLVVRGRTLLDVAAGDYQSAETREEARALMRVLIAERLHGQALHTRSILMELNEL